MSPSIQAAGASRSSVDARLVCVMALGSGCAALIYEVVWFQLLQLVIGLTTASLGLLLGAYMGGMGLGSLLAPRLISTRRSALRAYAGLEWGIGLFGLLLLGLLPVLSRAYIGFIGHGMPGIVLRAGLATVCLLPPTVLMGATLPILARALGPNASASLGFVYGTNIVGGVIGCLLSGFYLLRVHDASIATWVAAGLNAIVGLLAWQFHRPTQPLTTPSLSSLAESGSDGDRNPGLSFPLATWVMVGSGAVALGSEVVWTRLLSLVLGGTVYTFSIILAIFLAGLGLGSGIGAAVTRLGWASGRVLAGCQFLSLAAFAWTTWAISRSLPFWPVNPAMTLSPWFNFQLDLARAAWALLPPTVFWGATFTIALAAVPANASDPSRRVGMLYAANTAGAIIGALCFSLWLIPGLGSRVAQQVLLVVGGFTTVVAVGMARSQSGFRPASRGGTGWAMLGCVVVTGLIVWTLPALPWGVAAYGRFMATYGRRLAPGFVPEREVPSRPGQPDIYCTYLGEGMNGTVAVTRWRSGIRNFHSAGKVQASNDPRDMHLQRMLGHLSALATPKAESVLVVACGAGVTAGSFVVHPETRRIVICDIEPLVPRVVAPMFAKENHAVVADPRTQVISDDGRHFISTTTEKFDVITSDPIDPWVKGCAALNTVEYFEACKAHLKPGGVMSLWIPLYESDADTVRSSVATFFKVFPNGTLWSNDVDGGGYDAVLLGQAGPTVLDLDQVQERLDRPDHVQVKQSLAEAGFPNTLSLLATYAASAEGLSEWLRTAQINTDRTLRLQYLAGMSLNGFVARDIMDEIRAHQAFPDALFPGSEVRKRLLQSMLKSRMRSPPLSP